MGDERLSVSESFETQINGRDGGYRIAARPSFYTEQFEKVCPYYISFGMTYDQFWNGDVEMAKAYREAHEISLDEQNDLMWLNGMYVYNAIAALAPALKAFAKGRAKPYLEHPLGYEEKQRRIEKENRQKKERDTREKARTMMELWAISFNEKWEKKQNDKLTEKSGESDGGNNDTRD